MTTHNDVDDLIRRLKRWKAARAKIASRPTRVGKALPNTELSDAITYLSEYADVLEALAKDLGEDA